jgi:hypothetical protein
MDDIYAVQYRVKALDSQPVINRNVISDISTADTFRISGILLRLYK